MLCTNRVVFICFCTCKSIYLKVLQMSTIMGITNFLKCSTDQLSVKILCCLEILFNYRSDVRGVWDFSILYAWGFVSGEGTKPLHPSMGHMAPQFHSSGFRGMTFAGCLSHTTSWFRIPASDTGCRGCQYKINSTVLEDISVNIHRIQL